jgi:putative spermidine/putrescine transport system substrate-binding protein
MNDNRDLIQILARLAAAPPHVADFGRRELIRRAARFGLGAAAMAALTRPLAFAPAFAAETAKLPEFTSVPAKLKGSGVVRVCSWGGALQAAQRKAYFEPFERLCGIKVIESEGPDSVKVKAMVDTGNVEYDVGEFDRSDVINLEKKGAYWEPIDWDLFDTQHIDPVFRYKYSIDMLPYAQIMAYRSDAFGGRKPSGWKDFWDLQAFPGPRTMSSGAGGLVPELELAEIAAGTPMDKVYPVNIDAAYASLAKVRPAVVKWWTAGAMPAQMLADKEVVLATAWNGRIDAIQRAGAPVAIGWDQGMLRTDLWAVPKGAANRENAMKFSAFITLPEAQARLSMLIPYGFVNSAATAYLSPERLAVLPTAPAVRDRLFVYNSQWWADNVDTVSKKWASWVLE